MLRKRPFKIPLAIGVGLFAVGITLPFVLLSTTLRHLLPGQAPSTSRESQEPWKWPNQAELISPSDRITQLEAIARSSSTTERSRARFLLADELIQQGQGQKALDWLEGLEQDYPILAAQIAVKRAQAYEKMSNEAEAQAAWTAILQRYPTDAVSAEALFALGRQQSQHWDQAIAKFPSHPRTIDIVQKRLQQNPNQPQLLLLLARHGLFLADIVSTLDQLTSRYSRQLRPQDWEAIAFGYWEHQEYLKAGKAYAKAPLTSRNLYRVGRGLQLGNQKTNAQSAYKRLIETFPQSDETGLALMRLSKLVAPPQALPYLEQAIQKFPQRAAEALLAKASVFETLHDDVRVSQTQQTLLKQYASSDAAAELRWTYAQQQAQASNLSAAIKWAKEITIQNPDSELAPEALFWMGKWSQQLGRDREAQTAFRQVLAHYRTSYYAWRSAVALGWNVGDFKTVRYLNPCQQETCATLIPNEKLELTAGSATLRELHRLGLDREAWELWQVEFKDPMQPTVAEQFTDGILRQGVGDYLDGIFMVSFLSQRDDPTERSHVQALKKQKEYWQALYPLPYLEPISTWAKARQLNPLLVIGLMRQESRFEANIHSSAGAIGLMQILPETADWVASKIKLKQYDLEHPIDNIQLGTWYLDYTHAEYSNNSMLAVASYNAGPGNVSAWVKQLSLNDPDQFVEKIPFDETRGYVKSVFENYWNYLQLYSPEMDQKVVDLRTQTASMPLARLYPNSGNLQ
jgi:soluble lytic murein transglycosylase